VGAINEALGQIELAPVGKVVGETLKDLLEDAACHPRLVAAMDRLICGISLRKLCPGRSGA
jgi:hypothetical protein